MYLDIDYDVLNSGADPRIEGGALINVFAGSGALYDQLMDRYGTGKLRLDLLSQEAPEQAENYSAPVEDHWAIFNLEMRVTPVRANTHTMALDWGDSVTDAHFGNREAPPAGARLDVTLVTSPTAVDAAGEVASLPASQEWIDEWTSHYAEVWASTPDSTDLGVIAAEVDLLYDTDYFTATAIEYGPAFDQSQTGTIDDAGGMVDDLGAETTATDVGDDAYVLLARVYFEPLTGDPGVDVDPSGPYMTAVDHGLDLDEASATLEGPLAADVTLGNPPPTELWPVMYDLDDSGLIDFGDFTVFATEFGDVVGEPGAEANDFDHSGQVDFGDFTLFATNFAHQRSDPDPVGYDGDFPDLWRDDPLVLAADLVAAPRLESTASQTPKQRGPLDEAALAVEISRMQSILAETSSGAGDAEAISPQAWHLLATDPMFWAQEVEADDAGEEAELSPAMYDALFNEWSP
jgi:hypothetical protein